jgi:hypothetical protein
MKRRRNLVGLHFRTLLKNAEISTRMRNKIILILESKKEGILYWLSNESPCKVNKLLEGEYRKRLPIKLMKLSGNLSGTSLRFHFTGGTRLQQMKTFFGGTGID